MSCFVRNGTLIGVLESAGHPSPAVVTTHVVAGDAAKRVRGVGLVEEMLDGARKGRGIALGDNASRHAVDRDRFDPAYPRCDDGRSGGKGLEQYVWEAVDVAGVVVHRRDDHNVGRREPLGYLGLWHGSHETDVLGDAVSGCAFLEFGFEVATTHDHKEDV